MTRRNPPAKWALPDIIDPTERLCFVVPVPKNRQHIAAFRGAILELARWYSWQEDEAHTASAVANVWKDVYDNVTVTNCVTGEQLHGMEIEELMPIRIDCDCRVWVTCCDGTEKQLVTDDMINQASQPSTGKRPPNGGSYQACYDMQANQKLVLPYTVYPGDTLELTGATGAGNDGGHTRWDYANGDQMFGGIDVGYPAYDGTDPLTTAYHMRLIYGIGDTPTYVDAMGGIITVGGSGPQQVWVQVNDADIANNSGSYHFCVNLVNHQSGVWEHTFDFTISSYGWYLDGGTFWTTPTGQYVPGIGFQAIDASNTDGWPGRIINISKNMSASHITSMDMVYSFAVGPYADGSLQALTMSYTGHYESVDYAHQADGTNVTRTVTSDQTGVVKASCGVSPSFVRPGNPTGGSGSITKVIIRGIGVDPF